MTRVDSHHHFWNPSRREYPWMIGDALSPIRQTFAPQDLRPLLDAAKIEKTVLVQTVSDSDETREFLQMAAETDFIAGVVGWVDLTAPDITDQLADLTTGPGGDYLVGIRHQVHDEGDPDWILRPEVTRGIAAVGAAGLVYDLLIKERELPASLRCIDTHPEVKFVIDHLAKPRITRGELEPWSHLMAQIATRQNVWCKLSGMMTEADWLNWTAGDIEPYTNRVLEWFGEDRVLFGSDWPVCLLASEYSEVLNTLERLVQGLDEEAKAKLFGGNAAQLYSLKI